MSRIYAWKIPVVDASRRAETTGIQEVARFRRALRAVVQSLESTAELLEDANLRAERDILGAHVMLVEDEVLVDRITHAILAEKMSAEAAVECVLGEAAELMSCSAIPVLAERSSDFRDLALQLEAQLIQHQHQPVPRDVRGAIITVPELFPSIVIEAHALGAAGFIVQRGTAVSHGAILAAAFGLPAMRISEVLPPSPAVDVLLDADEQVVIVDPPPVLRLHGERRLSPSEHPPTNRVARFWLSITEPSQLEGVAPWIDGVGLYRSETMFLQRQDRFPTEDEQLAIYRRLFAIAGRRPVVMRTVDLGGDKQLAHMRLGPQKNPYLGLRAHRLFDYHPEIVQTQLRAMLRAAAGPHDLRILFPMIESVEALDTMRGHVAEAIESLEREGVAHQNELQIGALVETPSAAWGFAELLMNVDFVSIGTNDLVQYLFAAERGSAYGAPFYRPEHPVFLRLLADLAAQARDAGVPISVCGEIAGDPHFVPLLAGLGFDQLTMTRGRLRSAARSLSDASMEDCERLAQRCIHLRTAAEVRGVLGMQGDGLDREHAVQIDPICGMVVTDQNAAAATLRDGEPVHFCSRACRQRFEAEAQPCI